MFLHCLIIKLHTHAAYSALRAPRDRASRRSFLVSRFPKVYAKRQKYHCNFLLLSPRRSHLSRELISPIPHTVAPTGWPSVAVLELFNKSLLVPGSFNVSSHTEAWNNSEELRFQFDVGIHLRNQLGHFENSEEREDSEGALSASSQHVNSSLFQHLLVNFEEKLSRVLPRLAGFPNATCSPCRLNSTLYPPHLRVYPQYTYTSHVPIRNGSVYISSDNEEAKQAMAARLRSKGYSVYHVISNGIIHSKSSGMKALY